MYKWITTEERTEGVFIKPKCDPPYRTAALVHGRITRGLINSLTDVEAVPPLLHALQSVADAERDTAKNEKEEKQQPVTYNERVTESDRGID